MHLLATIASNYDDGMIRIHSESVDENGISLKNGTGNIRFENYITEQIVESEKLIDVTKYAIVMEK